MVVDGIGAYEEDNMVFVGDEDVEIQQASPAERCVIITMPTGVRCRRTESHFFNGTYIRTSSVSELKVRARRPELGRLNLTNTISMQRLGECQ